MPETEMGPLIRPAHRQRMASYIDRGIGEGAALVVDGRLGRYPDQEFFLDPTLFDHVSPKMAIAWEEIFGPVLNIMSNPIWLPRYQRLTNLISAHSSQDGRLSIWIACFLVGSIRYYGDLPATGTDAFIFYPERCVMIPHWWSE